MRSKRTKISREGGVLVEALVAISMLLVMLACAWFTHAVYAHKLAKIYEARNLAWGATDPACTNDGQGNPERAAVTAPYPFGDYALEVGARTELSCNEVPQQFGDLLAVLEWGLGAGAGAWHELLDVVDAVRGEE